jgi:hypothetical protein
MNKMTIEASATAVGKHYEPTTDEKAAMQAMRARRIKTPQIKATPTKTGAVELSLDHPDRAHGRAPLMNAFATGKFFCIHLC